MSEPLRRTITVGDGGKIEVVAPELPAGAQVEVDIRVIPEVGRFEKLTDMIGAARGAYDSRKKADAVVRELRDEWDD